MAQFVEGIIFSQNDKRYYRIQPCGLEPGETAEEVIVKITGLDGWTRALDIVHAGGITTKFFTHGDGHTWSKVPRGDWQYQLMLAPDVLFPVQVTLREDDENSNNADSVLRSSNQRT